MNQGIEILIARMDSNPEEFVPDIRGHYPAKWRQTLLKIEHRIKTKGVKPKVDELLVIELPFLKDEEVEALWNKLQSLQADLFTKQVMNTLLQDNYKELSSFAPVGGARALTATLTLSEAEHLQAHVNFLQNLEKI
jgi:hypothetical protein